MTKILCIGDPHFKTDNEVEVNMFIERIISLLEKEQPDLCVILGDVLHTHENVHVSPLNKAYEFITKVKNIAETVVLVGNHDMINQTQYLTKNHWMNGMKEWDNLTIVDTVIKKTIGDNTFYFSPYTPNGRFVEALNTLDEEWRNATCIFAHQEFLGSKFGGIISTHGDAWDEKFPQVISGHIHGRQTPQSNILYTGSALQNCFGESDKNTISIFNFSSSQQEGEEKLQENIYVKEVDLLLPRKKIIYVDISKMENFVLPENQDKIKVTIKGDADLLKEFKKSKKYKDLLKNKAKIVFKPTTIVTEESEKKKENVPFLKVLRKCIKKDPEYKQEMLEIYSKFFT